MMTIKQREERNKWIIKDYLAGENVIRIGYKHQLTSTAIYNILRGNGIDTNRQAKKENLK